MSGIGQVLVGLAMAVGLVGIVLPLLPGLSIIVGALLVWALVEGTGSGWTIALVGLGIAVVGTVAKYLIPKRRLEQSGVPQRTVLIAGLAAVVGFFVVPIVGAPIGFVGALYFQERSRLHPEPAWPATKASLVAVATSIGIELVAGLLVVGLWLGVVLFG